MKVDILQGDCIEVMRTLHDESIDCCVTSPPYWGLRDYGVDGQLGLENTPEEYVAKMVDVFREVKRVLKSDGTCWVNLGDCYAHSGACGGGSPVDNRKPEYGRKGYSSDAYGGRPNATDAQKKVSMIPNGLKPKDLVGIPWRVAFALQADGWWLRQDIIWCLSGGTWLYVRTQKGDMPMMVRDMARMKPGTVKLWNGQKWTPLLGISKSSRQGNELEIVLRSGERISCTPTHRFPTKRGLLDAKDIRPGDVLQRCNLPEPERIKDCVIDDDAAWFAGLYVAEGSRSGDTIQISGHTKEEQRWERVKSIAAKYGGTATRTVNGNCMDIRVYGKVLNALVDELTTGKTAKTKGFAPVVWRYSNSFISAMVDGYLSGDGHLDGDRWRLGFTRNYNLERDLRTACARVGWQLTLNLSSVEYNGRKVPTFRGEIRKLASDHWNAKDRAEVVGIRKSRCREVYDLGVADDPHLFSLASGVLTHNSKPNPMPESITDRCTKAHEYVFLLTKSSRYWYDADAVKIIADKPTPSAAFIPNSDKDKMCISASIKTAATNASANGRNGKIITFRNLRSVWSIPVYPYSEAHFATFPPDLVKPCILAGCRPEGTVLDPFGGSGTTGMVAHDLGRNAILIELNPEYIKIANRRIWESPRYADEIPGYKQEKLFEDAETKAVR